MQKDELMLKIENVSKVYRLGEIGGTTLRDELQRLGAKIRHKEDPTKKIGTKNYNKGEKFKALDNISFEVKKGERIGIIGHNGAGKSTLLKLISRVTGPTDGKIYLNGRVASMLEVGTGFHPELTGRENVYMNGAILGMTKKEIDAKMEDIIEFSEVRQFIDTPVKRYSSGMYVKLAFSVAAHLDSEIMIMDEVLAVGDMAFQNKCLQKMKDVSEQEDRTILYVSHNMNTIRQLCERVIVLNEGRIIFDGDVSEGILLYMGQKESDFPKFYNLVDTPRPSKKHGHILRIDCLEFLNCEQAFFDLNKTVSVNLKLKSSKRIDSLFLLFSIFDNSQRIIGSFQTAPASFSIDENGIKSVVVDLDFLNIAPGNYYFVVDVFTLDQFGNHLSFDHPLCNFNFKLYDEKVNCGIKWNNQFYGCVKLRLLGIHEEH